MEADLAKGALGSVGSYDVSFQSGFLVVAANASFPPGEALTASFSVDSNKVLDALAAAANNALVTEAVALAKALLSKP